MFKFIRVIIAIILVVVAIFSAISGLNNNPSCAEIASRLALHAEEKQATPDNFTLLESNGYKPLLVRGIVKKVQEWLEYMWQNCTSYHIAWDHYSGKISIDTEPGLFRLIMGFDPKLTAIASTLFATILLYTLRPKGRRACA